MRVLLTSRPLLGHLLPMLPLADALAASGHTVAVASAAPAIDAAKARGRECFSVGLDDDVARARLEQRFPDYRQTPPDRIRRFFFAESFVRNEVAERAADLAALLAQWRPDIIVHEIAELAAPLVAAAARVPCVDHGYGLAVNLDALDAAAEAAAPLWRARGVEPRRYAGVYSLLYLDVCPPSLQTQSEVAAPATQPLRTIDPPQSATRRARPTVYVSFGTVWNRDLRLFETVLDGLRGEPLDVVMTVGPTNDPAALGPQPPNIRVHRFVPQSDILPYCSGVVTHGGSGSVLGALAHGLPLVVVPQGADQYKNASRIADAGAGIDLSRQDVTATAVRASVRRILADPAYAAAASQIRAEIAAMPGPEAAVAVLERLALTSGPLH
jgi:UDP:flavonoid glycosyltransferase YjiC (YdhE family)